MRPSAVSSRPHGAMDGRNDRDPQAGRTLRTSDPGRLTPHGLRATVSAGREEPERSQPNSGSQRMKEE